MLGIGSLGFGFDPPAESSERALRYFELTRNCRQPLGLAMNPAGIQVAYLVCASSEEEFDKGWRARDSLLLHCGPQTARCDTAGTTSTASIKRCARQRSNRRSPTQNRKMKPNAPSP